MSRVRGSSFHLGFAFFAIVLFTTIAPSAFGQLTGDLQVNVSDATSAGVPNAAVTVRSLDTGATRTGTTGVVGEVSINQLAVGRYEVTVSHDGFATTMVQGAVVGGTSNTVSVTLNVAAAA